MKEFIDKLIERLEEERKIAYNTYKNYELNVDLGRAFGAENAIEIVNELSEEYKGKSNIIDDLKIFLQKKFDYCAEQAGMNLEAECNSEIASYFRDRKELYLDRANIYGEVMREIDRLAKEYNKDCCEWKQYDENDIYYTGCEQIHMFIDGSPTDNKYEFCPYCGKKIKVAPYTKGEAELYRAKSVDGEYQEYKGDWK